MIDGSRVKIAALSATVTGAAVVVAGGFVLWLISSPESAPKASVATTPAPAAVSQPGGGGAPTPGAATAPVATTAGTAAGNQSAGLSTATLAEGVLVVDLVHRDYLSDYDEESGHLMVLAHEENQSDLYDTSAGAKLIASSQAPAKPTAIAAKRVDGKPLFVVGGETELRLDVLSGDTGALVNSITTKASNFGSLAGDSRPENPTVYFSIKGENPIGRVNLQSLTEDAALSANGEVVRASGDGESLYTLSHGYVRSESATATGTPSDQSRPSRGYSNSARAYVIDAYGAYVAIDRTIVSADLQTEIGAVEFMVAAFIRESPWVVGVKGKDLCVASINDFRTVATVPLPEGFFQSRDLVVMPQPTRRAARNGSRSSARNSVPQADPSPQDFQIFPDTKRQRLLVVSGTQLAIVPLAAFKLPQETSLALQITGPKIAEVYKPVELAIRKIDLSVELKATALPKGMALEGDHLKWTPAGDQLGPQIVKLEAARDRFRRTYDVPIVVSRPIVDLPFAARHVALSTDGGKAVVWGHERPAPNENTAGKSYTNNRLAVVEVATRHVIATREMPREVRSAAIDDSGVYVIFNNTEPGFPAEVHRLNLADLSVAKTASTEKPAENMDQSLVLIGGTTLAMGNDRFRVPELERLPSPAGPKDQKMVQSLHPPDGVTYDYGDMIWTNGVLWNADQSQALVLVKPPYFFSPEGRDQNEIWNRPPTKWGRHIFPGSLEGPTGQNLIPPNNYGGGPFPLSQLPVACTLVTHDGKPRVVFNELVKGEETQTIALDVPQNNGESSEMNDMFKSAGNVIAVCCDNQLHFISPTEVDRTKLAVPFRVALKQTMVLGADRVTKLNYELLDGHPPYQLKLTIGGEHVSETNANDGSLSVDTSKFTTDLVNFARGGLHNLVGPEDKPAERLFDYIEFITPMFEKITGRKPTGVPVFLPVRFEATDRDLNVARLSHAYFIELPRVKVVKELEASVANNRPAGVAGDRRTARREEPKANKSTGSLRREEREKLLRELAADYSSVLLKKYPPEKVLKEDLDSAAETALAPLDKAFAEALDKHKAAVKGGVRNWSDRNGHSTSASLLDLFADQVVLGRVTGGQVTVPIEKLSPADQAFVKRYQEANAATRADEFVPAQMELMLRGIYSHRGQTQCYPPAYVASQDGKHRLSWRVLILPYIGGEELFKLFRLDEPWDSEHNQKLLKHRPAMFGALDENVPATKTTIVAMRGKSALLSDDTPVAANDVADPLESIAVLAEVKPEKAVEWTRPDDLDDAMLEQLADWFAARDDKTFIGLADGVVRTIPSDTPAAELRKAIAVGDGATGDIKFSDSLYTAVEPLSLAARLHAASRLGNKDHSLEQIPIGKFVLATEKPNPMLIGALEKRPDGLTVRSIPFGDTGGSGGRGAADGAQCVASPDGIIFGLAGSSLVRYDPGKDSIERQATLRHPVNSLYWTGGKLALVRDLGNYHEIQTETGAWRRLEGKQKDLSAQTRYTHGLEVWIVDPTTLKTLRGFVVPGNYFCCVPDSDRVLVAHGYTSIDRIDLVDLTKGEELASLAADDPNKPNEKHPERAQPNFDDVGLLGDGQAAVGMDEDRLSHIDFADGQLTIQPGTHRAFDCDLSTGLAHVYVSPDAQFVGVRVESNATGFMLFKTPEFGEAYGRIPTTDRQENRLGLDMDRKIAYVTSKSGTLRVLAGDKTQKYSDLPRDCRRILAVPRHDAVLLLGSKSLLVSMPGKSDKWSFDPLPKNLDFAESTLRATTPATPLAFTKNAERNGAMKLENSDCAAASWSGDGEILYLLSQNDLCTVSAIDTKTWQERRRMSDRGIYIQSMRMTASGPLIEDSKNAKFELLDGKTLDGVRSFKMPEIKSFVTSPGCNFLLAETNAGDLRLLDVRTGKLIDEVPRSKSIEWDAEDLRHGLDMPTPSNLAMSQDGGMFSCSVIRVHFLRLSDKGFEHYCRSGRFENISSGAILSPTGKYAVYVTPSGSPKPFLLPNIGNASGDMFVGPMAIDDRGCQYGGLGEHNSLAVFKPNGTRVYTDPFDGKAEAEARGIALDPTHPGRFVAQVGGKWYVIDVKE